LYAFNGKAKGGALAQLWSGAAGFWPSTFHNANLVPTVANGMVYVASDHQLAIFGLLTSIAQTQGTAKLQTAPPPLPLVNHPGALMWGTINSVRGSRILLAMRTGKSIQVDMAKALRQRTAQSPVIGWNVAVNGDFNPRGILQARRVWRVKGPKSWGADIWG
jgi:hypothetical protein